MKFPEPPPLKCKPQRRSPFAKLKHVRPEGIQLLMSLSIGLWVLISFLLSLLFNWLVVWPLIRAMPFPWVWAGLISFAFMTLGFRIGMWSGGLMIIDLLRNAKRPT